MVLSTSNYLKNHLTNCEAYVKVLNAIINEFLHFIITLNDNLLSLICKVINDRVAFEAGNKYDKESSEVKKELTILEEQKLSITSSLSKTNLEIEEIKRVLTNNTNKLNDINKDYKIAENNINKLNTELNMLIKRKFELNNKKDILKYYIENMSKVPFGVKSVLNNPSL